MSTGFLYGIGIGFLSTLVSSVAGAFVAFIACRKLLKRWVENLIRFDFSLFFFKKKEKEIEFNLLKNNN